MNKIFKSKLSILLILLGICISLMACNHQQTVQTEEEKEIFLQDSDNVMKYEIEEREEEKILQTVSGEVTDGTMQTITVMTKEGEAYTFSKSPEVLEVGESGVMIGNLVTVSYYGTLDQEASMQNVEIVKIAVQDGIQSQLVHEERAREILSTMTLEDKVGQMFIARCPDIDAAKKASDYALGGYILFGRDFKGKSKEEVVSSIESYQAASKIKMFIGVDEEGGTVNRVSLNPNLREVPFRSSQDLYEEGGWELIESDTKEKATLLKSLGINLNLAPVCDVAQDESDYIFERSFGTDKVLTAQYVEQVVRRMNEEKIGCTLKHFPGYGDNVDTHTGIAYDKRSYTSFQENDFIPFQAGIQAGAGSVLVSHNIIECIDSKYPASLSYKVHQVLREELKFKGVIMTDDLVMEAIKQYTKEDEAAVIAVQAGNDMLCCTNFETQIPAVIEAVKVGEITKRRIDESVIRILCWKLELGIIQ